MTDLIFATYDLDSGTAAGRPVAPVPAGGRLYIYMATDTGAISIWNGTAWVNVAVGSPGPVGPIGPPGPDPEEPFEPFFVTGPAGSAGAAGAAGAPSTVPGPMGLTIDPDDPLEAMIVPGPSGPQGSPGPVGFSGLDADDPQEPLMVPGPPGIAGPLGPLGPPGLDADDPADPPPIPGPAGQGFTSQGAWSASGTYNPFDVVTYGGSTWLVFSAVSVSSLSPDRDTSHFILWAAKGATGTPDFALIPPPFNPLPLELAAGLTLDLMLTGLY